MHRHNYTPAQAPKPSKAIEALIVVATLLVFALWGAMLAYYG
jgi:hypothetical protein